MSDGRQTFDFYDRPSAEEVSPSCSSVHHECADASVFKMGENPAPYDEPALHALGLQA
jgi:hypothetical protein